MRCPLRLSSISLISFCFLLTACGDQVIKRNRSGYRNSKKYEFNPVRKKVALLKFFNESPFGGEDVEITATEEMRKELVKTGEFIIDRKSADLFGSSKMIYTGGGLKLQQLSRKARLTGLNFVVFGRVVEARVREKSDEIGIVRQTRAFTEAKIEIRIFDVHSNKEVYNELVRGYADDKTYQFFMKDREDRLTYRQNLLRYSIKVAIRRAIPKVLEISSRLDWIGRVARIIGTKIYINAGRSSGINIGDILKIVTEGKEIYDPETGALIGIAKGEPKGTLEVIDFFGPDGAITILHSGGSVVEGDFVKLY